MKKNLLALFAAAAVAAAFSSSAMAAPTAISSGAAITTTNCPVLGDTVRLNLSKGVSGSYDCSEVRNAINVGACHASGSRSSTLTCAQTGVNASNEPTFNNTACNAGNVGTDITVTTPSYRGYRASTTGGSVGAQSLSTNCSASTVVELVNFQ